MLIPLAIFGHVCKSNVAGRCTGNIRNQYWRALWTFQRCQYSVYTTWKQSMVFTHTFVQRVCFPLAKYLSLSLGLEAHRGRGSMNPISPLWQYATVGWKSPTWRISWAT